MLSFFALLRRAATISTRNSRPRSLSRSAIAPEESPAKISESVQAVEGRRGGTSRPIRENHHWNPEWLKRYLLILVTAFSFSLSVSIVLLLVVSHREHGLPLLVDSHYTWTYGPTLIFILFVALWRQIDFHCKALAPWLVLRKQERAAKENVLLDYISPFQLSSLISAIRNKHSAVVIASFGFLTVKLLALTSTSLISPLSVSLTGPAIDTTYRAFKSAVSNDSVSTPGLFEPAAVYEAYAVSAKGLPYSEGVAADLVHETIDLPSMTRNHNFSLTGEVRALVPKFECQSAPFELNFTQTNSTELHPEAQIKLGFPDCTLRANGEGASTLALNPQSFATPPRQLSPLVQRIDCFQQTSDEAENWQLLTLVDFRYNQTIAPQAQAVELGDVVQATSFSTNAVNGVGVACRSSYKLEQVSITYTSISGLSPVSISIKRTANEKDAKFANLLDSDIGDLTTTALSAGETMFGSFLTNAYEEEYPNTLFKMMASLGDGTYASLLDETRMIETAQTALQQIALQTLNKHLVSDVKMPIQVRISYDERRLVVNTITAAVMISGSSILAICGIMLILIRPHDVTTRNPELLSTAAAALKQSPLMQRMLKQAIAPQQKLKYALQHAKFHIGAGANEKDTDQGIQVYNKLAIPVHGPDDNGSKVGPTETRWFRESTTRRTFLLLSIALPMAAIAALEALQQASDKGHGFVTVARPNKQIISLLPNTLSAAAMLGIATMFNTIEFNISMLAPLRYLQGKVRDPRGDLLTSYLGSTPPKVLFVAFLRQHWSVMLSTSAALIGSVLTIVVSGLYTFETQSSRVPVSLNRLDTFDITWPGSAFNDSTAAVVSSLTESTGLADPAFTYQELAFPRVQHVSSQVLNSSQTPLLQTKIPALRASLDCVALDPSTYNFTSSLNPHLGSSSATFSATMPLPENCQHGGPGGNESTIDFQASFSLRSNTSYIGKLLDLHVGPYDDIFAAAFGELAPHTQPDNPPECPSLAFIYGYADTNDPAKTTADAMVCTQRLDQISTAVTFTPKNMSISVLHPPVTDEALAGPVPNAHQYTVEGKTYTPYRIQQHFDKTFISNDQFRTPGRRCSFWNSDVMPDNALEGSDPPIDAFWQGVLCADPYLPVESLRKSDTGSESEIFTSVQAFYRRYMAKAIDANMRRPINGEGAEADGNAERSLEGVLINSERIVRLVQNNTPKIILQVMLGCMSVLMGMAVWMCRLWEPVVQYNPCTIAGKMVLFAGSRMCDSSVGRGDDAAVLPDSIEEMDEVELRRFWRDIEFKLGWWEGKHGKRRWGIDAVEKG